MNQNEKIQRLVDKVKQRENTTHCYECGQELKDKVSVSLVLNQVFCSQNCQDDYYTRIQANRQNFELQKAFQ